MSADSFADTGKASVGNVNARDHAINQFLKHKPEGVAEISINHTDSAGNIRQQKVGADGSVTNDRITQTSDRSYYNAVDKLKQRSCSKSRVSFSGVCSKERWDQIFGKKEDKKDA
jgi:hypothetical protein